VGSSVPLSSRLVLEVERTAFGDELAFDVVAFFQFARHSQVS